MYHLNLSIIRQNLWVAAIASFLLCYTNSTTIRNGRLGGCYFTLNSEGRERESKQWEICGNATEVAIANIGNITAGKALEIFNCFTKCLLVEINIFDSESNKYNSKGVQKFYETNSNATIGQVAKLQTIYDECNKFAGDKINALKKNGTDVSSCLLFSFFEPCVIKEYSKVAHRKPNSTPEKLC